MIPYLIEYMFQYLYGFVKYELQYCSLCHSHVRIITYPFRCAGGAVPSHHNDPLQSNNVAYSYLVPKTTSFFLLFLFLLVGLEKRA
jgi:hypothetical protein